MKQGKLCLTPMQKCAKPTCEHKAWEHNEKGACMVRGCACSCFTQLLGSSGTAPVQEPTGAMIALDDLRGALEVGSLPNTAWGRTFIESRCRIVVAALRSSAAPPPQNTIENQWFMVELEKRVDLITRLRLSDESTGWAMLPSEVLTLHRLLRAARGHPDTTGAENG